MTSSALKYVDHELGIDDLSATCNFLEVGCWVLQQVQYTVPYDRKEPQEN